MKKTFFIKTAWLFLTVFLTAGFLCAEEIALPGVEEAIEAAPFNWLGFLVPRIFFILCVGLITLGMHLVKTGRRFTIRPIPGLEQLELAVGRATEMGRPALFCTGVSDTTHPEFYASMPILTRIARVSARYRNRLIIPVCMEKTLSLLQSTYETACREAGENRLYNPSDVRFFPGGQVYFAAASMGYMLKERPAACFYFGYYELESLLLSETGQVVGAMQIAGTSQLFQIPFFIAACDYVIIGEELFAVSASISGEPILSGSLFGQDCMKIVVVLSAIVGTILATLPGFGPTFLEILSLLQK